MTDDPEQDVPAQSDRKPQEKGAPPVIPVDPDAISAIGELFLQLERILTAQPPPDMDAALAEQRKTVRVLAAFSAFVSRSCPNLALKNAIGRFLLDHALRIDQLSNGVTHPTLTAATRPGRKFDTYDIWNARKFVCLILECLIRGRKYSREQAAEIVASELPILQRLMRDATEAKITENRKPGAKRAAQAELEHAILSWHSQFQQGTAPEITQGTWSAIRQLLDFPASPTVWGARADLFWRIVQEKSNMIMLPSGEN